jgi:hypothetical protein
LNHRSIVIDGDDGIGKRLQEIAGKENISHGFGRKRGRGLLVIRRRSRHDNLAVQTIFLKSISEPACL